MRPIFLFCSSFILSCSSCNTLPAAYPAFPEAYSAHPAIYSAFSAAYSAFSTAYAARPGSSCRIYCSSSNLSCKLSYTISLLVLLPILQAIPHHILLVLRLFLLVHRPILLVIQPMLLDHLATPPYMWPLSYAAEYVTTYLHRAANKKILYHSFKSNSIYQSHSNRSWDLLGRIGRSWTRKESPVLFTSLGKLFMTDHTGPSCSVL